MSMHISNANNQCSWACSPYLCASHVQEVWSFLIHLNVAPSLSMSIFDHSPVKHIFCCPTYPMIIALFQLLPLINFHKRYVIPIKSLDTNWKSVNLIVTKDCIGIDGWGLNLAFLWTSPYVGMTLLEFFLRYHIGSLTLIPFGGALPLCHSMSHSLVNLVGEELASFDDHLKLRITCGTTFLYDRYHMYKCDITWNILPETIWDSSTN